MDRKKHEQHFLKQLSDVKDMVAKHQRSGGRRVTPNLLRSFFDPPLVHQLVPKFPLLERALNRLLEDKEEYVERRFYQILREGRSRGLRITLAWLAVKCSGTHQPPTEVVRQVRALWAKHGLVSELSQAAVA